MRTQINDKSTAPEDFSTGGPNMEWAVLKSTGEGTVYSGRRSNTGVISFSICLTMEGDDDK
jgi:hypothetical protein